MLDTKNENLQDANEDVKKIDSENIFEQKSENEEVKTSKKSEIKTEEEVVNQIEEEIAESSEKEDVGNSEEINETKVNYDSLSLEELVVAFEKLLKEHPVQKINNQVNAIKNSFNSQFSKILAEKKSAFLAEGGESIDFSYSNPFKIKFNELNNSFRNQRTKYYKNLESQLKDNLELRFSLIEQLKDLIENADPKTMYQKFRDIQERWKKIGPVSREKYNGTWRTFHHHVERFYDLLHLSNDFRELDFKHNLEEKLKLIARVEALSESNDINYSFKQLQVIHKLWKEDIGPVAREYREDVWQRFSAATKKIHDKRHNFYKNQKGKYEENIAKKFAIIEEISQVDTSQNKNHSDWQKSIKLVESLRDKFFKAGGVPKSESEKIWTKFKEATRNFNLQKNAFYKNVKGEQQENLNKKLKLIELAESYKESEDWDSATEIMKKIQSDWKKIGHVPRKYSDKIWGEFKAACNHYFDRYHENKNKGSKEEQEIVTKKKEFLEKFKKEVESLNSVDIDTIKSYASNWRSLGKLPYNLRHIESKFAKTMDKLYAMLSVDKEQKEMLKFEGNIEGLLAQQNVRKLDAEQIYIRKKLDETIREIQQLENNISFFSNAKSDNPLLINVVKSIERHKQDLSILKAKLSYMNKLEY